MTILSDSVLVESRSARDQLAVMPDDRATQVLNKVKALMFAAWHDIGVATTEQMAEFYEVPVDTVRTVANRNKDEFESDGLREVRGKDLKALLGLGHDGLKLPESTTRLTIWTPRAALRLGMVLRDSLVAKQVRTALLDVFEASSPVTLHATPTTDILPPNLTADQFCRLVTAGKTARFWKDGDRETMRQVALAYFPQVAVKLNTKPIPQQLDLLNQPQPQDPFAPPHNWDYSFGAIQRKEYKEGESLLGKLVGQITLIDRVRQLGYEPTALQMGKIAMRCVVRFYWDNRRLPAMHGGYLGFESFIYDETDLPLIDQVIHNELEDDNDA